MLLMCRPGSRVVALLRVGNRTEAGPKLRGCSPPTWCCWTGYGSRVCTEVRDPEEHGRRQEEVLESGGGELLVGARTVSRSRPGVAAERSGPKEHAVSAGVQNVEE